MAAASGDSAFTPREPHSLIQAMRRHRSSPRIAPAQVVPRMCHSTTETWVPPPMVTPDPLLEEEDLLSQSRVDFGEVITDAQLFALPEKVKNGPEKIHSIVRMPSQLPQGNQGPAPCSNIFNILMADVSGSMNPFWKKTVQGWNQYVAPTLTGRTNLYVFSSQVLFCRSSTRLEEQDFLGGGTDLVGALQTIVSDVYQCKEKYVKVFFITDGHHTVSKIKPETVIMQMQHASGKICDVYVLGVGNEYPVQHSVDIRSRLHNGNSNFPYLYEAKVPDDMRDQMIAIGSASSNCFHQGIRLSVKGSNLPGADMKDCFHLKEWVYFPFEPQKVQHLSFRYGRYTCSTTLEPRPMLISNLSDLFRQWNSCIIQLHRRNENVPLDVLNFKERLFNTWSAKLKESGGNTIQDRLARKEIKTHETNFRMTINKMKAILESKTFKDEQELAENILSTTVGGSKYEAKVIRLKGHTDEDFKKDVEEFLKVYNEHKASILKTEVTTDECCRVTLSSTLSDLQDADFPVLVELGKYEFLKQFTITGIPVFTPTRDAMTMTPWSYTVRSMLTSPYTILSQVALESFADSSSAGERHKDVKITLDGANTCFNAIIPVFPPNAAKVMEPFVRTRLYAMCVTFAILKNPHVIDYNIHMAALGATWLRILYEYPSQPRPEFVRLRVESIEATANLYIKQQNYAKYWQVLRDNTAQALMTESTIKVDDRTVKCESLIKPMFLLYMRQRTEEAQDVSLTARIVRMIVQEFVGRCLSNYKVKGKKATPYMDFFAELPEERHDERAYGLEDEDAIRESPEALLKEFYTYEEVKKAARQNIRQHMKQIKEKLTANLPIKLKMAKVLSLRNVLATGDISWSTLRTFAREVGLTEEVIDDMFSEHNVSVYVAHALQHKASRERLLASVSDYDTSLALVAKRIQNESINVMTLAAKLQYNKRETSWMDAYKAAHKEVVHPMTRQEIVTQARQRGIEVTDDTFDQVYKRYRPDVGLLGNACQSHTCPFYLVPNKRYNQHAFVERRHAENFPHSFHRLAYQDKNEDLDTAVGHFKSGMCTKNLKPPLPSVIASFEEKLKGLQLEYRRISPQS